MFLFIIVIVTHSKKCACVRVICFFALRDSVRDVMSVNLKEAFNDIPLAGNVDAGLRCQHWILQHPLTLLRSCDSSIMRSYKALGCQFFSDRQLLLCTDWISRSATLLSWQVVMFAPFTIRSIITMNIILFKMSQEVIWHEWPHRPPKRRWRI